METRTKVMTEMWVCALLTAAVSVCPIAAVTGVAAVAPDGNTPDCFRRLEKDVGLRDSITVFTIDSTVIRGTTPIFIASPLTLYMRPATGSGSAISLAVPFDKISRITYTKASPARGILVFVGMGVGVVAGALAGAALAPEPKHWLEFPELFWGTVGAVFGGLIGAAGGWECGKHMRITVTLRCN